MRTLSLVRHAVTAWNHSGRFQGHSDVPLSPTGEVQAEALRRRFARLGGETAVYSSPLSRALQTAQIALPERPIVQDARLKELHFGLFEGRTLEENRALAAWSAWSQDPFKRRTPDGESYEELRERAVAWLGSLPDTEHVVAVTHSGTIQMLLSSFLGLEYPRWRKGFLLRYTSVTRVLLGEGEALIERVNDARHLGDENEAFGA